MIIVWLGYNIKVPPISDFEGNRGRVCIEPWYRITDNVNASGILKDKERIISIQSNANWKAEWELGFR